MARAEFRQVNFDGELPSTTKPFGAPQHRVGRRRAPAGCKHISQRRYCRLASRRVLARSPTCQPGKVVPRTWDVALWATKRTSPALPAEL
jgi:hypothetical protein